ncbi:MAG: hypothetical protein ACD_23C01248G0001, partial [uncultured bacterium]
MTKQPCIVQSMKFNGDGCPVRAILPRSVSGYLRCELIRIFKPLAPGRTGSVRPSRSPAFGVALPDFEIRAPTTTIGKLESLASATMLMLSSSTKLVGRSFTCLRST